MTKHTSEELQQTLVELTQGPMASYNPTSVHYIKSLLERADGKPQPVASLLEEKAQRALKDHAAAYHEALRQGQANLAAIETKLPQFYTEAAALLENGNFKQLQKIAKGISRTQTLETSTASLTSLLNQQAASHGDDPDSTPLEEQLRSQEADVVRSLGQQTSLLNPDSRSKQGELKSARRFRNAQVKLNADKLVTQAIEEIPEGAGPLNAQRLAAKSLASMRDLSPYYLSRFVTYMDTLFWLEQTQKRKKRLQS